MRVEKHIEKKKTLRLFIFLLCLSFLYASHAQTAAPTTKYNGIITGIVTDSGTHATMSHVTVTIKEMGSHKLLKTTFTNERGFFKIPILSAEICQLIFTCSGYKARTMQLKVITSSKIDVGSVEMAPLIQQLPEVRVIALKPLIEQDLDELTYNVDVDPESQTATTLEILRKVPMLSLDADDNLQLNGTNNYRVYINGKPSLLLSNNQSDVFKSMSASAIKTIEVITTPSARYQSQGVGGIINITTYKKNIGGYNGGLNLQASDPKGYMATSNLTASVGKVSIASNYGYTTTSSPANNSTFYRVDKMHLDKLEQTGTSTSDNRTQNWGNELIYQLNDLNMFTGSYIMNEGRGRTNFLQQAALLNASGVATQMYQNINVGHNNSHGNDISLEYQRNFKKNNAQQLTVTYRTSSSVTKNNSAFQFIPLLNYTGQAHVTENKDGSGEYSVQADYVQPIRKHILEMGISAINRHSSSDYFYKMQDAATSSLVLDTGQSNGFNYREHIYAGYLSLYLKFGKWGLRTGARLEAANVDARFISTGSITKHGYINAMPNITLSHRLKGLSLIKVSYGQSVNRPELYYLDPYVDRTDPWNISYGNPQLQPSLAHVFNLGYNTMIKKTFISVNAFHQFTNNAIQQITRLGADTIARTTFGNIGQNKNFSIALAGNTTLFRRLSINLNSTTNYVSYSRYIEGKPETNQGVTYSVSGAATLRVKQWHASTAMSYTAPAILAQGKTAGYTSSSLSMNRYLFKNNKVNIGFAVNNPLLKQRRSIVEINDPAFYQFRETFLQVRRTNVFINYRFTKVTSGNKSKDNGRAENAVKSQLSNSR